MSNRNKKIFAGSMAAVLLLGASSLAWFTDRTEGNITGQAGSLCIEMTDIEGNLDLLAPGDKRDLSFEYENLGSLAMDTRITYALSYELDEEVASVIENDLDVIATLDIDGDELVLTADENIVTGTFEAGTIKGTNEDVGLDKLSHTLSFNFDESVGNIGQKMKFKLDVLVEGKQNRNNPTWEQVHKTTVKFGDVDTEVVPVSACNVVDDNVGEGLVRVSLDEEAQAVFRKQEDSGDTILSILYFTSRAPEGGWTQEDYDNTEDGTDPVRIEIQKSIKIDLSKPTDITEIVKEIAEVYSESDDDFVRLHIATEGHEDTEGFKYVGRVIDMSKGFEAIENEESYEYEITIDSVRENEADYSPEEEEEED